MRSTWKRALARTTEETERTASVHAGGWTQCDEGNIECARIMGRMIDTQLSHLSEVEQIEAGRADTSGPTAGQAIEGLKRRWSAPGRDDT